MGNTQSVSHRREGHQQAIDHGRQRDNDGGLLSADHSAETSAQHPLPRHTSIYGSIRRLRGRNHQEDNTRITSTIGLAEDRENIRTETDGGLQQGSQPHAQQARSRLSRIGSSLLPDHVLRGLLNSEDGINEEGSPSRQRTQARRRTSFFDRPISLIDDRFALSNTFRRRPESGSVEPRHIRGPFPAIHSNNSAEPGPSHSEPLTEDISTASQLNSHGHQAQPSLRNRRTRLSRARNSIYLPLSSLFGPSRSRGSAYLPRSPTPHPGQTSDHSDSASLSDSYHSARHDRDNVAHELDAVEPETRHLLSASRITSGMSSIRRFPHGLRSRSTRLIRRGEHPPLSQVLQLAAAAIAAQLSGHGSEHGNDGPRSLGGEAFDGSIQNFVQTLQEAASAQAGEDIDLNATDGDLPPVNFMRVFQFPNDENGVPIGPPHNRRPPRADVDGSAVNESDRSVTLVLVGVRSMPNLHDGHGQTGGAPGPSLDTLLSLPFMPPANILRNGSSGALFRRSDTRLRSNRHHSPTHLEFSQQDETQGRSSSRSASRENAVERTSTTGGRTTPTPISESPLGPHPPPSTPADHQSGHVTPTQRPVSASAASASLLPQVGENRPHTYEPILSSGSSSNTPAANAHQRRRSETGFARRPDLGSGAARRNGMVEPDRPPGGAGRSWLIYVVGTNVSPDHPAFTMPSLFTDNPSYEDMQMLSTLLGPVKPPVATQDDINSAGGVYRLIAHDSILIAVPLENEALDNIAMIAGDRCLICLCDYEAEEQVRQLNACSHIFHRDCIDEWLTTGRNSCPMCRGQGVKEQGPTSNTSPSQEQTI